MANLGQELEHGGGEERADGQSDEKGEGAAHVARGHERHQHGPGEGEDTDQRHTEEGEAPHWAPPHGNREGLHAR